MTLLVRDEEDILVRNIEYHLKRGVDFIIATTSNNKLLHPDLIVTTVSIVFSKVVAIKLKLRFLSK